MMPVPPPSQFVLVRNRFEYYPGIGLDNLRTLRENGAAALYLPTPWCRMLCSCRVWAILLAQFGHSLVQHFVELLLPVFYLAHGWSHPTSVQHAALCYAMLWLGTNAAVLVERTLVRASLRSRVGVTSRCLRCLFNTAATVPGAVLLVVALVVVRNRWAMLAALSIMMLLKGAAYGGFKANMYDITDYFYEELIQMAHFVAGVAALVLVAAYAFTVTDEHEPKQFLYVGCVVGGCYLLFNVWFVALCTVNVQYWDGVRR